MNGWVSATVGVTSDSARAVAIQSDGKIVVGTSSYFNAPSFADFGVVRFNSNGSLDTTFDGDGIAVVSFNPGTILDPGLQENLASLKIADDGKIVLGGTAQFFPSPTRLIFARLNSNGSRIWAARRIERFGCNARWFNSYCRRIGRTNNKEKICS
jgi:uncharacterized delta-60 repeat protein